MNQFLTTMYIEELDREIPCYIEFYIQPAEPDVGIFEEYIDDISVKVLIAQSLTCAKWEYVEDYDGSWALQECVKFQEELDEIDEEQLLNGRR